MLTPEHFFSRRKGPIRLGLDRIRRVLGHLGNPHLSFPSILVAGTNGKGSVAATLSALLTQSGYETGLYTSPHLVHFNERFRLNEREIENEPLSALLERVIKAEEILGETLSFFEISTVLAFLYFADKKVDIAVLEVGLGGRLDATNVARKVGVVLTDIGLDHQVYLGSTLDLIAAEKADVIAPGSFVVSASQAPTVKSVIQKKAHSRSVRPLFLDEDFFAQEFSAIRPNLQGDFQRKNLALALKSFSMLREKLPHPHHALSPLPPTKIQAMVDSVRWPGRFQEISHAPRRILDGAHNPMGVSALFETLLAQGDLSQWIAVCVIKKDKDAQAMLKQIPQSIKAVFFPGFSANIMEGDEGFHSGDDLMKAASFVGLQSKARVFANWPQAWEALDDSPAVLFGSLYFIGALLTEKSG